MSATGLDVFDKTLQTTHIWLNEIGETIGPDKQIAWKVLAVVLHKLRDRLPVDVAAHLGAELPLLVRGVYYDQFRPATQPSDCRDFGEFMEHVQHWLSDIRPVDAKDAIEAVFAVLSRHVPQGQIAKVKDALPHSIRDAWNDVEDRMERGWGAGEAGLEAGPMA
jgi:uncharacterized protein (DUF2267 family)